LFEILIRSLFGKLRAYSCAPGSFKPDDKIVRMLDLRGSISVLRFPYHAQMETYNLELVALFLKIDILPMFRTGGGPPEDLSSIYV
jgi:hypothetical protein